MSRCEGFLPFQGLTDTPWRWGRSQSLKCQKTFTSWQGCLPKNISLS